MMQLQQMENIIFHRMIVHVLRRRTRDYYNIIAGCDLFLIQADHLPDQPCDPVAYDTVSNFFTDRNPYSAARSATLQHNHDQTAVCFGPPLPVNSLEFPILL